MTMLGAQLTVTFIIEKPVDHFLNQTISCLVHDMSENGEKSAQCFPTPPSSSPQMSRLVHNPKIPGDQTWWKALSSL